MSYSLSSFGAFCQLEWIIPTQYSTADASGRLPLHIGKTADRSWIAIDDRGVVLMNRGWISVLQGMSSWMMANLLGNDLIGFAGRDCTLTNRAAS